MSKNTDPTYEDGARYGCVYGFTMGVFVTIGSIATLVWLVTSFYMWRAR